MPPTETGCAALTIHQGPERGRVFALREGEVTIGRSSSATIRLRDGRRLVSGLHARILAEQGRWVLRDESRNGTWTRRGTSRRPRPVGPAPHVLVDGEVIVLTDGIELRFSSSAEPARRVRPPERSGRRLLVALAALVLGATAWLLARLLAP